MSREQRQKNADSIANRQSTIPQKGNGEFDFEQYHEEYWEKRFLMDSCPVTKQGKPLKRTLHTR